VPAQGTVGWFLLSQVTLREKKNPPDSNDLINGTPSEIRLILAQKSPYQGESIADFEPPSYAYTKNFVSLRFFPRWDTLARYCTFQFFVKLAEFC